MKRPAVWLAYGLGGVPTAVDPTAQQIIPQFAGIMNVFVGGMLVLGILFGLGGFIEYITHLGLQQRDNGLAYMKWGIYILFTLAILLWFAQFIQKNVTLMIFVLGALVVLLIGWFILSEVFAPSEKKEEKK